MQRRGRQGRNGSSHAHYVLPLPEQKQNVERRKGHYYGMQYKTLGYSTARSVLIAPPFLGSWRKSILKLLGDISVIVGTLEPQEGGTTAEHLKGSLESLR